MGLLADIGLLLGAGMCGCLVLRACRAPMPAFIGPMIFAGALNYHYLYPDLSLDGPFFLCKALIGVTMGRRLDRDTIAELRDLPLPALLTSLWMLGASLATGFILHACSDVSLSTALIGSSAGGVTEMTIFALALGADVVVVAFIQMFRLVSTLVFAPFAARVWIRHAGGRGTSAVLPAAQTGRPREPFRPVHYALLALTAIGTGGLLEWLRVPAGSMFGGMIGAILTVSVTGRNCVLPGQTNALAQFVISIVVAKSLTHDTILAMAGLFGPLFLPTLILLILCLILSAILKRLTDWDAMTCILSTMPAGMIQIVPLAEEYGADVLKVGMLHAVRLISIIVFLPWIIRLILHAGPG